MKPSLQNNPTVLVEPIQTSPRVESLVTAITGPRGSGKTTLLTFLGIIDMKRGCPCMSNYEIEGEVMRGGKVFHIKSLPLDLDQLISLDESLQRCVCCIDEINLWFAAIRHMSNQNRIIGIFMQMIRKRQMSVYYTTQNLKWVDDSIRWQTDIQVVCQDAYHTIQGKEEGVGRGEYINFITIDKSGYVTGVPYDISGRYTRGMLEARPIWPYFNTDKMMDPWQALAKLEIKRPIKVLDLTGEGQRDDEDKGAQMPDLSFMEE